MSTELTVPGSSSILNKKIRSSDLILTVLIYQDGSGRKTKYRKG